MTNNYLAMVHTGCVHCGGLGFRSAGNICSCVWRNVFRVVMGKFRECSTGGYMHGRKRAEFQADVFLVAKRTLTDPTEWDIFRFFHLLGADWKLCGRRLGMDKGAVFHVVYRVEERLGRVFAELRPFSLYPLDEYFQKTTRPVDARPFPVQPARLGIPLMPPLAERAPAPSPAPLAPFVLPVDENQIYERHQAGQTMAAIA